MSGRTDADGVSVNEKQRGYSGSSAGPPDDTSVHSRETPMPVEWTSSEPVRSPAPLRGGADDIPDVRKSLRKVEEVERDRAIGMPTWAPMLAGIVLLVVLLAGGVAVVVRMAQSQTPPPRPAPAPIEDLEGVPVRKGLNNQ